MLVRNLIEDMQQHASERGGKCLSKEYWDDISRLMWMCQKGHVWESPWRIISRGLWCPKCTKDEEREEKAAKKKEKCLNELKTIGIERGGRLLSEKYINNRTKLEWQCSKGHIWKTTPDIIINCKSWCPECRREILRERFKDDIAIYQKIAIMREGKLLSEEYINGRTSLLWECKYGHQWNAAPSNVKNLKQWCPYCMGNAKKNIKEMHELAAKHEGKCLSKIYINSKTKLEWQCSKGHVWKAKSEKISIGEWCSICRYDMLGEKFKNDIEVYRNIAIEKGGKLLSDEYINNRTKLLWECEYGHQWEARPNSVKNLKSWCPHCYNYSRKGKSSNEVSAE